MPLTENELSVKRSDTAENVYVFLSAPENRTNEDGEQLFWNWEEISLAAKLNSHSVRQCMVGLVRAGRITRRARGRQAYYTVTGNEVLIPLAEQEQPKPRNRKPKAETKTAPKK